MLCSLYCLPAFALLLSLAACSLSKKEDPEPAHEMSWTVDGTAASTSSLQSQKASATLTVSVTLNAGSTAASFVSLEIPNAVGTYTFGPSSAASAVYSSGGSVYYAGAAGTSSATGAGTIVVTAISATSVTGTFTFTGINSNTGAAKSLSNGKFNVGL